MVSSHTSQLSGLNPQQREAVECLDGPVLVLSGAGTGKTRVLTHRIAHLLASGRAKPWNVLAVTFTNRGAAEMAARVRGLLTGIRGLADAADQVRLATFHRTSTGILRRYADRVGLGANFTILDAGDQTRLLKQVLQQHNIDTSRYKPDVGLAVIDRWKDKALTPAMVSETEADKMGHGLWLKCISIIKPACLTSMPAILAICCCMW